MRFSPRAGDATIFKKIASPSQAKNRSCSRGFRAVVTRGSTDLVGQNTSCKVHKVCISLWPTGWDDVRTRAESPF